MNYGPFVLSAQNTLIDQISEISDLSDHRNFVYLGAKIIMQPGVTVSFQKGLKRYGTLWYLCYGNSAI